MTDFFDKDRQYLSDFLDKLADDERATLRHNMGVITGFSTPNVAVPDDGCG